MNSKPRLVAKLVACFFMAFFRLGAMAAPDSETGPALNLDPISRDFKRGLLVRDTETGGGTPALMTEPEGDQSRMGSAMSEQAAGARPRWNEPARVEAVPGTIAEGEPKMYKIVTPFGTYCVLQRTGKLKQRRIPCTSVSF